MKKLFLTAIAAGVCTLGASAQSILLDDPANHSYVGFRAGLDISSPTPDAFKNGAGFNVGAVYNAKIIKNFYIEPGVSLYYNTWGLKEVHYMIQPDQLEVNLKSSFRNFGIRVPIMVGYHFDFTPDVNVAVFTGPELSVGLSSRCHYEGSITGLPELNVNGSVSCYSPGTPDTGNLPIDNELEKMQNLFHRVDCAWKIGVGMNYSNINVSVAGSIGLTNMYKRSNASSFSDDSFRMNRLTVAVGYNF